MNEGTRVASPDIRSLHHFYAAYVLMALAAEAKGDEPALAAALENVRHYETHSTVDYLFRLVRLGVALTSHKPTRHEARAVELLKTFSERACRRPATGSPDERCEIAAATLKKLGAR